MNKENVSYQILAARILTQTHRDVLNVTLDIQWKMGNVSNLQLKLEILSVKPSMKENALSVPLDIIKMRKVNALKLILLVKVM